MKLTLAIPIYKCLHQAKGILGSLKYMTSDEVEWLIIDNASNEDVDVFVHKYLKPKRLNFIKNEKNLGLVETYQQIYENCQTEYLSILHDDVFIYEKNWDLRVVDQFEKMKDLGMIGFFGSQGCGPVGERIQDILRLGQMAGWSNMIEAEIHGMRMSNEINPVAIFDGFALNFRMEMLKKGNGIDQKYKLHHIYDRELGLMSLSLGYKNVVMNIYCHHQTGLTTGAPVYGDWLNDVLKDDNNIEKGNAGVMDKYLHDYNTEIFRKKWEYCLPLYVENDFSFRKGQQGYWNFKADAILKK